MTETDWYKLIRDTKSEIQSEFNEKNRALHKRMNDTVASLERLTDRMIGLGNTMATQSAESGNHLDKGQVQDIVDVRMEKHRRRCKEDSTSQTAIEKPDSAVDKALAKVILKILALMTSGGGIGWIIQKIVEG